MHFQKHHWIQMVNKGAGQPETVTGCLSHISSEEEHEKEKSLKSLREKKKSGKTSRTTRALSHSSKISTTWLS